MDKVIRELSAFVLENWEVANSNDKDDFLFSYEIQYNINKAKREALSRFHQLKKPRQAASNPSPLDLSWMEIVKAIKAEKTLEERLSVLEHAATLFRRNKSFDRMTTNERRAIAGTYGRVEEGVEGLPWGWFGTMVGQGDFKNLVNDLPRGLSAALDKIPLNGDVEEGQFGAFADAFAKAFKGKAHKGGVATASRLLSMKRPDVFVGVNGANRRGLCAGFGVAFSTLHLGNYWERIVVPIQLSPW